MRRVLLVLCCVLLLSRVHMHVEEHRVDGEKALEAARNMHPHRGVRQPGCQECTRDELDYCTGEGVLFDHCCCDMRHYEAFPYVPHTCYLQPECQPKAGNCAIYTRLRICCCDSITAEYWKALAGSASYVKATSSWTIVLLMSFVMIAAL